MCAPSSIHCLVISFLSLIDCFLYCLSLHLVNELNIVLIDLTSELNDDFNNPSDSSFEYCIKTSESSESSESSNHQNYQNKKIEEY